MAKKSNVKSTSRARTAQQRLESIRLQVIGARAAAETVHRAIQHDPLLDGIAITLLRHVVAPLHAIFDFTEEEPHGER